MVITEADNGKAISELAELIEEMGSRKISAMFQQIHNELKLVDEPKEA